MSLCSHHQRPTQISQVFRRVRVKLRKAPISFVMSVCPHVSARLPLDGFSEILTLETFTRICRENLTSVKIEQQYRALYMKTKLYLYCWPFKNSAKVTHCCILIATMNAVILLTTCSSTIQWERIIALQWQQWSRVTMLSYIYAILLGFRSGALEIFVLLGYYPNQDSNLGPSSPTELPEAEAEFVVISRRLSGTTAQR